MRALVIDHGAPHHLRLGTTNAPEPAAGEALVRGVATSLNRGEVASRAPAASEGTVLGWDAVGIVVQPAADGTGPPEGTPVLTVDGRGGGWAESKAVATNLMTRLDPGDDLALYAALPVAGLSALRALRILGPVLGRRILVTGASGGVGRFAVQLACMSGAEVVAVSSPESHEELSGLGASQTLTRPRQLDGKVFGALDMVGGEFLAESYQILQDPGGVVVSVGHAGGQDELFTVGLMRGSSRTIAAFYLFADMSSIQTDLEMLVSLVRSGRLDPQVAWRGPWTQFDEAVAGLLQRQYHGKAVLEIV